MKDQAKAAENKKKVEDAGAFVTNLSSMDDFFFNPKDVAKPQSTN